MGTSSLQGLKGGQGELSGTAEVGWRPQSYLLPGETKADAGALLLRSLGARPVAQAKPRTSRPWPWSLVFPLFSFCPLPRHPSFLRLQPLPWVSQPAPELCPHVPSGLLDLASPRTFHSTLEFFMAILDSTSPPLLPCAHNTPCFSPHPPSQQMVPLPAQYHASIPGVTSDLSCPPTSHTHTHNTHFAQWPSPAVVSCPRPSGPS